MNRKSVLDVCNFLKSRHIENDVLEKFNKEKIDGQVVLLMSDDQLNAIGIHSTGDRITLRQFCSESRSHDKPNNPVLKNRRSELLQLLKKSREPQQAGRPRRDCRTITVGMRVTEASLANSGGSCERQGTLVKSPLGDKNTISIKMGIGNTYEECLALVVEALFPDAENPVIGSSKSFTKELVNSRNQNLWENFDSTCSIPFTLGDYIKQKKIPGTPKLYLYCYPNNSEDVVIPDIQKCDGVTVTTETVVKSSNLTDNDDDELPDINLTDTVNNFEDIFHEFESNDTVPSDSIMIPASPSGEVIFAIKPEEKNLPDNLITTINEIIDMCKKQNILDPVEILRFMQSKIVNGRKLDIEEECETLEGNTNFILVDRYHLLETAFEEIKQISKENLQYTLEVQFYGECAVDYGGPRREFLATILRRIKEEYFDPIREYSERYYIIGAILAISLLQNGPSPRVFTAELVEEVFNSTEPRTCIKDLRKGLDALGIFTLCIALPTLINFFTPGEDKPLTVKFLIHILKSEFSPEGCNKRIAESFIYSKFIKYLREVASGRRGNINLGNILTFITGGDLVPVLGYNVAPSIQFSEAISLIPTANTCVNRLTLPITYDQHLKDEYLFPMYDLAFSNSYFGLM